MSEESKQDSKEQKKVKTPKTKHPCTCGMIFRHRYLLVRHIRLVHHEICPKCFGTVKTYSNESGDTIDCQFCYYKEHFGPGIIGRMNEKAKEKHSFSFYPAGYVGR